MSIIKYFVFVVQSQRVVCLLVTPWTVQPTRLLCHGIQQARILEWVVISFSKLFFFFFYFRLQAFYFVLAYSQLINSVVVVSGEQCKDSAIHIRISILPQTSLPCRQAHKIEQSSMCYTTGLCSLSILHGHVHTSLCKIHLKFLLLYN